VKRLALLALALLAQTGAAGASSATASVGARRVQRVFDSPTLRAFPVPLVSSLPDIVVAYGLADRKSGNDAVGIITVYKSATVAKTVHPASAGALVYRVGNVVVSVNSRAGGVTKADERAVLASMRRLGPPVVVPWAPPPGSSPGTVTEGRELFVPISGG
jgi:hypothetical protein